MRVLIASVDFFTAASIKRTLAKEKVMYDTTDLGEDGLQMAKLYDYDIIVLDLAPPDIDGYEMLQRLRAARVDTPILILSGPCELGQRVKCLRFGADDFLTKPFDSGELSARIQAIVRRSNGHSQSTIRTGKLVVNLDTHWLNGGCRIRKPAIGDGCRLLRQALNAVVLASLFGVAGTFIILFADVYKIFGLIDTGNNHQSEIHDPIIAVYFSFITWTTVGYGDFVPTVSTRFFAATEAVIGYVWMGLLISVLAWVLLTASVSRRG